MAQVLITEDNLTPLIEIITWFFFVVAIFGILMRGVSKTFIIHRVGVDDALIFISLLFAVGQTIAITVSAHDGLGKSTSPPNTNSVLKTLYVANLLYIFSLCLSKLSVVAMIGNITPSKKERQIVWAIGWLVLVWALTAEIAMAFQCRPPYTWQLLSDRCYNLTAFGTYLEITNLLTDATLIVLPTAILARIQTSSKRKAKILFFFTLRLMPMAAIISKLVFWNRSPARRHSDITLNIWPVILCTQMIQGLEIFATCCLNLPPFLEGLQTGFMHADDFRRRGQSINESYGLSTSSTTKTQPTTVSGRIKIPHLSRTGHKVSVKAGSGDPRWDAGSQHSQSQIIQETRTFAVESSTAAAASRSESQSIGGL